MDWTTSTNDDSASCAYTFTDNREEFLQILKKEIEEKIDPEKDNENRFIVVMNPSSFVGIESACMLIPEVKEVKRTDFVDKGTALLMDDKLMREQYPLLEEREWK